MTDIAQRPVTWMLRLMQGVAAICVLVTMLLIPTALLAAVVWPYALIFAAAGLILLIYYAVLSEAAGWLKPAEGPREGHDS